MGERMRAMAGWLSARVRRGIAVLGYHRVGDPRTTPYDPDLFTATAEELDAHMGYIRSRYVIVDLEEALAIARGERKPARPSVLVTFDDGYRDNFDVALPILRRHGIPAVFFVVSGFVGSGLVPLTDQIAWIVRRSRVTRIRLGPSGRESFSLSPESRPESLRQILDLFKSPATPDGDAFLAEVESACEVARPPRDPSLFLSWREAREMAAAGMTIACHTHTHRSLAKLSEEAQAEELSTSRSLLRAEVGVAGDVLAYPFGSSSDFSAVTVRILREAGFRAAFTYEGGINVPGRMPLFELRRIPVYAGVPRSRLVRDD